jgi:DNA-directed RNA polymerase subunit M/transcription elongation factor TFIIS
MSDDIVRLPPTDKNMGSCPECGKTIWSSYLFQQKTQLPSPVYRCIHCKYVIREEDLIPF